MPCCGYEKKIDWKRWARCCKQASVEMVAEGWWEKAGKFDGVMRRRAQKKYNN